MFQLKYLYLIICLYSYSAYSQSKSVINSFYFEEFKWSFKIPIGYNNVNPVETKEYQTLGMDAAQKHNSQKLVNKAKTIIFLENNKFNTFEANFQKTDSTITNNFKQSFNNALNNHYETFKSEMKGAKIDTSSSKQMIDGLEFLVNAISITVAKKGRRNWLMYSRIFNDKVLTINIMATDKSKEIQMLESLLSSSFGQNKDFYK